MQVENAVQPSGEQIEAFISRDGDGPVVMVNLLKFRDQAAYADGRDGQISGREAYQRYASEMKKLVEGSGGRFLFGGSVNGLLLGNVESLWDVVGLVEYPSRATLLQIATSPEYQAIDVHREAGLAGQLNIDVTEQPLSG